LNSHRQPKSIQTDIKAGFVVFLVALPLCLGIALASGAPLVSGLISGAIAGLLVAWISGSELSVSGPAAGLTVTIVTAITKLGGFDAVLVATLICGLLQIAFGWMRAGILASYFPNCVIKGMLAGIGALIVLKQIPHAVGWDFDYEGDESFSEHGGASTTIQSLLTALERVDTAAVIITASCALILWVWSRPKLQKYSVIKAIPSPLAVVLAGTAINFALQWIWPTIAMFPGNEHLVQIPNQGIKSLVAQIPHPTFSAIGKLETWTVAISLAIIASLETLLSIEASDKIDPQKRTSDTNRELVAQGAGNILCGLCGGLPMTSVIVRSSANVYAGAKTRFACFVHGLMLAISVLLFPSLLNYIPLAALAVVLISVGLKLMSMKIISKMIEEGIGQWLPFFVTIVGILFTDLLVGVGIGLVVGLLVVIRMNHHSAITMVADGNHYLIRFAKDVNFAHKFELKNILMQIPDESYVTIDGSGAQFIDHDIIDAVSDFQDGAEHRQLTVTLKNMKTKRLFLKGIRYA
jgi:MFS superfamily sulfate permease-like transporter